MKKLLLLIAFLAAAAISARAQVYVFHGGVLAGGQMAIVKVSVIDSLSKDPLPYASVYLTEKKDTTITHFALTDTLGAATLREVPFGEYKFHVEMMGFKPYVKQMYFRRGLEDMGIVQMQVDDEFIRAAMISDIGNPIVIKQDTIEYHAAAFLQDKNAVLKDLLTRMPGIDISDNGKVRVNGEEVSRITVNGKTFFFEDQSMALNNLPASLVDKIRVIDKKSDEERVTGIADGKRTKEVDVALKKEYEDGWFGNVAAKGGTTLDFSDNELRDDRGLLYSVKSMVSTYNPKEQLTFIGNASNISDGGQTITTEDGQSFTIGGGGGGLTTSAQLGINGVTTRVKDVELAASTTYNYYSNKSASKTLRTTFQEAGDMLSESTDKGFRQGNSIGASASARKESGNFTYNVSANFDRTEAHSNSEADMRTTRAAAMLNSSSRTAQDGGIRRSFGTYASAGYRGIGGNPMRSVTGTINYSFDNTHGTGREYSNTLTGGTAQVIDLHSNNFSRANNIGANLSYTEPLSKKFRLQTQASFSGSWNYLLRDAFNADGSANDYYSTLSDGRYLRQRYGATGSYISNGWQFGIGASAEGIQNRLFSRSQAVEALTGEEWIWSVIPRINISYFKESTNIYFYVSGSQGQPASSQMLPTLDVSNPTRISAGNIYLRPYTYLYSALSLRKGFPKKFSSLNASLSYNMTLHPVITAFWYDTHGVQYYVPVNAERPQSYVNINAGYNAPINKERTLTMELNLRGSYSNSLSYRASRPIEPLEAERTDYSAFMEQFWGDESGSRFYSGASGFEENNTDNYYTNERIHIKYNKDPWSMTVGFTNGFNYAHFSTPGSKDVITTENRIGMSGSYTTPHKFRIWTELNYNFFTGYAEGYGRPEWHWDQSIAKDIGTFTLSISAHDILGQMRNLSHIDAADYMQDSYRLILGRYVMFGIKWNFGKMNAVQNRRAQMAQDGILFY